MEGIPQYNKFAATSLAMLLGAVIFDFGRVGAFRPRLLDVPMLIWCMAPFFSSLTNGLGPYDGTSAVVEQLLIWGIPYFIGRLYFADRESLRELAMALVIGGLIYVPLCLYEIRMSPQLHAMFYGFHQHDFSQTVRLGGWRPTVFMQHGLAVGMFMTAASAAGVWLWYTGAVRRIAGVPMLVLIPPLLVTTVMCKSMGALLLLIVGLAVLFAASVLRTRLVLIALLIPPLAYIGARTALDWQGAELVQAARVVGEQRAASLNTRIYHETLLLDKALQRPAFGWGRWGRNRVFDEYGRDQSITDGLWIISAGTMGLVGLAALIGWLAVPPWVVFRRVASVKSAATAAPLALAVILSLYTTDMVLNAMLNQMWMLISGALVSAAALSARARRRSPAPVARLAIA
jgi:O-antigen ligase